MKMFTKDMLYSHSVYNYELEITFYYITVVLQTAELTWQNFHTHCCSISYGLFIQPNSIKGTFTCQEFCFADPEFSKFFSLRNTGQDGKYFIRKYTLKKTSRGNYYHLTINSCLLLFCTAGMCKSAWSVLTFNLKKSFNFSEEQFLYNKMHSFKWYISMSFDTDH